MHTICDKKLIMVRPEKLIVPPGRIRKNFDEYELKSLAKSISVNGIIQPLLIRQVGSGCYEIIAGERRLKAAVMAGLRRVPCIVHKIDSETGLVYSLIENIHCSGLDSFEKGTGIEKLITISGLSQREASARLGIAQTTILNCLKLLRINEEQREKISELALDDKMIFALIALSYVQREEVIEHLAEDYNYLNNTTEYIKNILKKEKEEPKPEPQEKPLRKFAIGDIRLFYNSLLKLTEALRTSGIGTSFKTYETERYTEYRIKIKKEHINESESIQMRLC